MSLARGVQLGPYEIIRLIGAGGMGEVYEARDTRLGREVAVKLLPTAFASDNERLRRFQQEARATAALNHPSVLAVYDVGLFEGSPYLVSELLEGQTLRERMNAGPLSLTTCVGFATEIAEGLQAAHDKGIVHRDLKPENLFITSGQHMKILDFGLARLTAVPHGAAVLADFTAVHTMPFTIVGTPGYMSPEQARGQESDQRSDIFSFGCVLYEMIEGRRPFAGTTPADTVSAILKDPVNDMTSTVHRPIPPALQLIVRRCLEKEPAARFQSAGDLAFVLKSLSSVTPMTPAILLPPVSKKSRDWRDLGLAVVGITGVAIALLLPAFGLRSHRPTATGSVIEFLLPPPGKDLTFSPAPLPGLAPTSPQVGISPDGKSIAFVATSPDGQRQLWIRSLDSSIPRAIPQTQGVNAWPFWSPNSRSVVVAFARALQKVDVASGAIERICPLPDEAPAVPFVTGSWGDDGTILFSIGGPTGIYRVAATGGSREAVTTLEPRRRDNYHSWPQLLPGRGGRFLVFVRTDDGATTGVYAGRLRSRELSLVVTNTSAGVYASGHLLRATEDRILAQPFDPSSLRLSEQPVTLVPSIYVGAGRTASFWASTSGNLVYAMGGKPERQFKWLDAAGAPLGDVGLPALYVTFDLSPDGTRLVTEVSKPGATPRSTLSTIDTVRGVVTPLTLGEVNDSDPRFGPHGDIVFARNSGNAPGVYRTDPAGGAPSLMFARGKLPVLWMESWAHDGSSVVYRSGADPDAWQVMKGASEPKRLTQTRDSVDQVQLSPDHRWVVYNTQESGQYEVYVAPVPPTGERWQISVNGGVQGTWRGDGHALYYLGLDSGLYVVDVAAAATRFAPSKPRLLFRTGVPVISPYVEQYRPTADGRRFLFCLPLTSVEREPLRVLLNWPAKLASQN